MLLLALLRRPIRSYSICCRQHRMREIRTSGLMSGGEETWLRLRLRHRHRAKAAGNSYSLVPTAGRASPRLYAKIRREGILLQYSRLLETRAVIFHLCPSTSYRRWGSSRSPRPPNSALLLPRPTPPNPNPSRCRITSWCPPIISGNLLILPNLRPRDGWQFPRKGGIGARLPCYHIPVMISPHAYSVWWSG